MIKGTNWPAVDFDFLKKKFDYPYGEVLLNCFGNNVSLVLFA